MSDGLAVGTLRAVSEHAIEVRELRKRFGDVQAVDGVSFEVRRGEVFGVVGPNGAGKTTTLEMIEGLREPDAGQALILGEPVWPHPERVQRRIGVQLQTTALFDFLTATELLELFCRFYGPVPAGRAAHVLKLVGLEEKGSSRVNVLSGGQKQRLAIALALVHEPEIVFLDEPTTGLDPQARRNLWDVVRAIEEQGRTVVLTTHYMEEAERLCHRVAIMDTGRVIALDTPSGLVRQLGAKSRVVLDGHEVVTDDVRGTLAELAASAPSLAGLAVLQPNLEDVYLALTGREYRE